MTPGRHGGHARAAPLVGLVLGVLLTALVDTSTQFDFTKANFEAAFQGECRLGFASFALSRVQMPGRVPFLPQPSARSAIPQAPARVHLCPSWAARLPRHGAMGPPGTGCHPGGPAPPAALPPPRPWPRPRPRPAWRCRRLTRICCRHENFLYLRRAEKLSRSPARPTSPPACPRARRPGRGRRRVTGVAWRGPPASPGTPPSMLLIRVASAYRANRTSPRAPAIHRGMMMRRRVTLTHTPCCRCCRFRSPCALLTTTSRAGPGESEAASRGSPGSSRGTGASNLPATPGAPPRRPWSATHRGGRTR